MSKVLKFIVHFVVVCTIVIVLGLALPPFFGVSTVIVDKPEKETNLAMGSVTYAIPVKTEEISAGAPILVKDENATYRYNLVSVDTSTGTGVAIDPKSAASENINVSVKNWVPKVVVTIPLIGYLLAATESTEGLIVLVLAVIFLIILYLIAEVWKKNPEAPDEYEDYRGDTRHVKTEKELKMEEKAREKRMQEEDRELLYGEKARRKQAKKEEKEKRKKIRTGGFVDEIYEDDLEDEVQDRRKKQPARSEKVQAATSEAHELLKKEIAAATADEAAATMEFPEELTDRRPKRREVPEETEQIQPEEDSWEEEEPAEAKEMAMPVWTAAQLADKARRAGDAPDIVRDSITKVTLFDYSDIIGGDMPENEEE